MWENLKKKGKQRERKRDGESKKKINTRSAKEIKKMDTYRIEKFGKDLGRSFRSWAERQDERKRMVVEIT